MTLPPAPWDVVLGNTPDGQLVILPGPQGIPGAAGSPGATGPVGPIAAPLAHYLLDIPDAGLINGIVVHRALGPDRVPASPNAMDDEMITATTGYNAGIWTPFNVGLSTYNFDALGGLRIDCGDSDSVIRSLEQPMPVGPWSFTAKIANGAPFPGSASNKEYLGISIRSTVSGRWDLFYLARRSQINQVIHTKANADSSFVSDTFSTWPDPVTYYYLRVSGGAVNCTYEISTNGLVFAALETTGLYAASPDRIGLFFFCNEAVSWSGYVQSFRRTV